MSSGDESDDELTMLEDIRDSSQSHLSINMRESPYKICYRIKRDQAECKGALLSTQNISKFLHKVFKAIVNDISQVLPIFGESGSEFSYSITEARNFAEVTRL